MLTDRLSAYCTGFVEEFAKRFEAVDVEVYEDEKYTRSAVKFKILQIDFMYVKNIAPQKSTLYTRIYLNKNASIFYHIPEIVDKLDEEDYKCYYFSYIESEERMKACFAKIEEFYVRHWMKLKEFSMDSVVQDELERRKKLELEKMYGMNDEEKDRFLNDEKYEWYYLLISYEDNLIFRYTFYDGYIEYLKGNYEKASAMYGKLIEEGNATYYEKRIADMLGELDGQMYEAINAECASVLEVKDYDGNVKDAKVYLKNFLISYVICGIIFLVIESIMVTILKSNTIYTLDTPSGFSLLMATLPGVLGSLAFRRRLMRITRKNDVKKALAFDELINGKKTNALINVSFVTSTILLLAFIIWLPFISVRFYDDYFLYNDGEKLFSFAYEKVVYDQIEEVCYVEGRYNAYGEYIDRASYVVILKDGEMIDFDGYTSVKETEENVLELLGVKQEDVKRMKSIEEHKR